MKHEYIAMILSGEKTTEARLTASRIAPFDRISLRDVVYFKALGGEVEASARVSGVRQFEDLTPKDVYAIQRGFNEDVCAPDSFWFEKSDAKFGVLVGLERVEAIEPGTLDWRSVVPAGSRSAWHILKGPLKRAALKPTG